jgi:hypothetical protein
MLQKMFEDFPKFKYIFFIDFTLVFVFLFDIIFFQEEVNAILFLKNILNLLSIFICYYIFEHYPYEQLNCNLKEQLILKMNI